MEKNNQTNLTAHPIAHANVEGKIIYYLRIYNGKDSIIINIAEKTYNKMMAMDKSSPNEKNKPS